MVCCGICLIIIPSPGPLTSKYLQIEIKYLYLQYSNTPHVLRTCHNNHRTLQKSYIFPQSRLISSQTGPFLYIQVNQINLPEYYNIPKILHYLKSTLLLYIQTFLHNLTILQVKTMMTREAESCREQKFFFIIFFYLGEGMIIFF